MKGADSPDKMSKFLPSKVINRGTALLRNSKYSTSSTAILVVCKNVKVFRSRLSINCLPFLVINRPKMSKKGGKGSNKNLGGIVSVLV